MLGLLIASTKSAFDTTDAQIRQFATTLILLHQTLADYGPETAEPRMMLRSYTARALADNWQGDRASPKEIEDVEAGKLLVRGAHRNTGAARWQPAARCASRRGRFHERRRAKNALASRRTARKLINPLFLEILIAWITLIFLSFGYTAPRNATVVTTLFLSAMALAACIFLIVEMDTPFEGLIRVSSAPMRNALAHMTSEPRAADRTQ